MPIVFGGLGVEVTEQRTSDSELKPGYLVIVTKWWQEGDTVPEGWTTIGSLNAERVNKCPDCGKKQPAELPALPEIGLAPWARNI